MAIRIFIGASADDTDFCGRSVGQKPVALNKKFSLSVRE
jgi:hypothetical protein